ncbi:MAG: tyrosine recombinase XerD [Lachnospiraceae bacterium]|nr:tyrosine recombinase XerD [Lachnospiraceae bacterium]
MEKEIREFTEYLEAVKRLSHNTVMSYRGDLLKMAAYLEGQGIDSVSDVGATMLGSYVLDMEKAGMSAATISRYVASIKAFFEYLLREHVITEDPSFFLKPPKVEKHAPEILTEQEMECLLAQPSSNRPKELRDRAMLELLYATGMRVSELITLRVEDVSLRFGWLICRDTEKERMIPFGETAAKAIQDYLTMARDTFLKNGSQTILFLNCSGTPMSRQGFWKLLKGYAAKAGIDKDITPRMFRHSCAAHMAARGAGLPVIQEMLGHTDIAATQIYAGFQTGMKTEYSKTHPRA